MRTKITELLNIKYPVIQGGMAWVAEAYLAAAVTNAGGLGLIAGGSAPADTIRREIRKARELAGNKPFGVNIMLMSPFAEDLAELVVEEKVPVVTTGAGSPGVYMERWKTAGIKVIPVVPAVALAKRMERLGADALIAEGCEAGGHIGELTTMALVPQVADSVDIPVIAAGGIADGRGLAASLMLGAHGVQCGTVFLTANECIIHETYKEMVLKAKDSGTMVTGRKSGHPIRSLKSSFTRRYAELEASGEMTQEELDALGSGALRKAATEGDRENGSFMAGQIAGMISECRPVNEILEGMINEAQVLLN
ncbi:MAG: enoyl-[acyl-carrier-protein] reductase FabK [Oscillospiraceae bacterium]|nr:enoyl-[acyl-carrier-protein] reductase FabK [Oscillospiraceae bacterium]